VLTYNSLNILKAYEAIEAHVTQVPSDRDRFPNFGNGQKPVVAKGPIGPLQGEIHDARYFHGRYALPAVHWSYFSQRGPEMD